VTLKSANLIVATNSVVAMLLALYIGLSIDLPRPYWSVLTVYVVSQPLSGALRSKGLYRVLGTIVGGIAAVLIVPTFVNSPEVFTLVMALWAGLCLFVSLLDRTPRAYAFMLSGYTAAIIGFPSVADPSAIFPTAVARVEEISLGIVCATVVHSVFFPRDVSAFLGDRVDAYLRDAATTASEALQRSRESLQRRFRHTLAERVTELKLLSTHLPFDTVSHRARVNGVRALQDRLAILLPLLTAVEDRLAALRATSASTPAFDQLVADIAAWSRTPSRAAAEALRARCEALAPRIGAERGAEPAEWGALLRLSAALRLFELVGALQDAAELAAYIRNPGARPGAHLLQLLRPRQRAPLHSDPGLAALSGLALVGAVLLCCFAWIVTAWPEGSSAALFATIAASIFATQDDPAPALRSFLMFTAAAIPLSGLYVFGILPQVHGFVMLAAVLTPPFFLLGYLQADPRYAPKVTPFVMGFAGSLGLQETYSADFPSFAGSAFGQVAGVGITLIVIRLFRTFGVDWSVRRILRRGRKDLAGLSSSRLGADQAAWTSTMLDRVGLITAKLSLAEPSEASDVDSGLADLRVGLNVVDLRKARETLHRHPTLAFDRVLQGVSAHFDHLARSGRRTPPPLWLLTAIDRAFVELESAPAITARVRGFAALVGLRRNLFPGAAPSDRQPVALRTAS
jgi:uncharacterized membrane protein YccC